MIKAKQTHWHDMRCYFGLLWYNRKMLYFIHYERMKMRSLCVSSMMALESTAFNQGSFGRQSLQCWRAAPLAGCCPFSHSLCALPNRHCPALCVSSDQITAWGDVWTRVRFLPQKGRLCVVCANLSPERCPGFLSLPHQPCRRTVAGKRRRVPSTLPAVEAHRGHGVWLNHWTYSFNLYLIPVCSAAR